MSNENNKEILDEIVDLRKKTTVTKKENAKSKKSSNMEDLVPTVEIQEDKLIEEEKVSNESVVNENNKELNIQEEKIAVVSKKDKFKKFLNLKEKQEKTAIDEDAKQARGYAWLAYILFFIPLFINRKNSFVRFHANEGLEVNIIDLIGLTLTLVGALIKPASLITILLVVLGIGLLSLTLITKIIMIIHSVRGKRKQSPWFFKLTIID